MVHVYDQAIPASDHTMLDRTWKYGNYMRLTVINKKLAENQLFLQIKLGRILDILWSRTFVE